jgi:hypothetical protein
MTHLTYGCSTSPFKKLKLPKGQILLQMSLKKLVEGTINNQLGFMKSDLKILNNELVEYFIESEMPFRHVENNLFRKLKKLLEPRFKLPSHITLQKDCMKLYEKEKLALKIVLCSKRVCVTTNT